MQLKISIKTSSKLKFFWKTIRSFLTNKGIIPGNELPLFEGEKLMNKKTNKVAVEATVHRCSSK